MADYIYVDNSNLYIEGKRVSAVKNRLAMNIYDAMNNRIIDHSYTISFGRLHEFVAGTDESKIARAAFSVRARHRTTVFGNSLSVQDLN